MVLSRWLAPFGRTLRSLGISLASRDRSPSRRPAAGSARRTCRLGIESLEERTLLAAAVNINAADALALVANSSSMINVSYASGVYTISDNAEVFNVTNNGTGIVTGNGTNTITVTNTTSLDFDLNGTTTSAILNSTGNQPVLLHDTTGGGDFFQIGSGGSAQGVLGPVTIGSTVSASTAAVDNQTDPTGRTVTVSSSNVTGLTPSTIDLTNSNLSNISLFEGTGADTVTVTGTGAPTTLQGSTLGDTVNVQGTTAGKLLTVGGTQAETINIGNAGSVQGILATVNVANNNNGSAITVDDSSDSTARTVSVGSVTLSGLAPASINFLGSEPTTIKGGTGGNTFTISGTPGNPSTLFTGTGNDTVYVQTTDAGRPLVIHGQDGADTVNIGSAGNLLSTINSSVTIDNTAGSTALAVNGSGSGAAVTATLSATQFTGASPAAINFANLSALTASFGSGATTVNVAGTPAGAATTLNLGSSTSNVVNLGDVTHAASGLGAVTLTGTTGLAIDDSADATAQTVSVTGSGLTIGAGPAFDYSGAALVSLIFVGGSGATAVNVTGTPAGATTTLDLGSSTSNTVNLGDATHAASGLGAVTLTGTTGLTIDDTDDPAPGQAVRIDSTMLTIGNFAPVIDYANATLSSLTFGAGLGGTLLTVHRSPIRLASPLAVNMGNHVGNAVQLGQSEADSLGNVVLTGYTSLDVDDSNGSGGWAIGVTATTVGFSNGLASNTFDFSGAALWALGLQTDNSGGNTVTVTGTPVLLSGSPLYISGFAGTGNTYVLGDATHAASGLGNVSLSTGSPSALVIDDSADASGQTVTVINSRLTIGAGPFFDYNGADLQGLTYHGGSGDDTVNVQSTPSALTYTGGGGADNVTIGNAGDAQGIDGTADVSNAGGSVALVIDDSADAVTQTPTITGSQVTGFASATVNYADAASLSLKGGSGGDTFTIDNNGTNAFPTSIVGGNGDDTFALLGTSDLGPGGTLDGGGGSNTLDYTGYTGPVTVNLSAGTATGTSGISNIQSVTPSNPPVSVDDSYTLVLNATLTEDAASGVLANDTVGYGNALTASVVSQPSHGSLTFHADGSFTYTPDADFLGNDSFTYKTNDGTSDGNTATVIISVVQANTTTALTSAPAPSAFGQAATLTATVTAVAPGSGTLTGTVSFFDGAALLGTTALSDGVATLTVNSLSVGGHSLTAVYGGDAGFVGSTSPADPQTVTQAASATALTSAPAPAALGQATTFTATVTAVAPGSGTPTGTVSFFDGATLLGTAALSGGVATFTVSSLGVGNHPVTAVYGGDAGFTGSTSPADTQTISPPDTVGVFDISTGTWYLRNSNSPGAPDIAPFRYGAPGWVSVVGDWNGDGTTTIGVVDPTTMTWYLKNSNSPGAPDYTPFRFGMPGWIPVVGDWTGSGHAGIGVFDPATATFYLRGEVGPGAPDAGKFAYGMAGWKPVVGDWNGDGVATVGVVDPTTDTWYLRNSNTPGAPDYRPFAYGGPGWTPVVGDWNGDGTTTVGVVAPNGAWYLRNSNSPGAPDVTPFAYGAPGWLPVAGVWTGRLRPLQAAGGALPTGPADNALTQEAVNGFRAGALARLQQDGISQALTARIAAEQVTVGPLGGGALAEADPQTGSVVLDAGAAGHGWFVDATPLQDEEFSSGQALAGGPADGRMDLLTAVLQEMGVAAGLDGDALHAALSAGARNLAALEAVFAEAS